MEEYAYGLFNNAWGFARAIPDILTFGKLGTSAAAGTLQDEGATAVLLGGMLGSGMSSWAANAENKALQDYAAKVETAWNKLLDYKSIADKHFVDNINAIYSEFDSKTGAKKYDIGALTRRAVSDYRNIAYFNEGSMADAANDPLWQKYNLDMSLASWVYRMRQTTDQEGLEEILQYKAEVGDNAEGPNVIAANKDKVLAFSRAYDEAVNSTQGLDEFDAPEHVAQFNNIYKRLNYYAGIKQTMLNDMTVSPEAQDQLNSLINDNNELLNDLKKNKKKLQKDYLEAVKPLTVLSDERAELVQKLEAAQDVTVVEQLAKDLAVLDYRIAEKAAQEGYFQDTHLGDVFTSDLRTGAEARFSTSGNKVFPFKRNRYYEIGREALTKSALSAKSQAVTAAPDAETKLTAAADVINAASLNREFTGTSGAELKIVEQELQKLLTPLAADIERLSTELKINPDPQLLAEASAKIEQKNRIENLLHDLAPLMNIPTTGEKYKGKPDLVDIDDQSRYDYFKATTSAFDSASKIVSELKKLELFENKQLINQLQEQIALADLVFTTRDDVSDTLKKRVMADIEAARKALEKLEEAYQANVDSRSLIQEQASQEVGEQFKAVMDVPEIAEVITQVFGSRANKLPTEYNLATVTGVLAALKKKITPEQQKTLQKHIDLLKKDLYKAAEDLGVTGVNLTRLQSSTSKFASWATTGKILPEKYRVVRSGVPSYIALFKETKNLSAFWRDLEKYNYEGFTEEEKAKLIAWQNIVKQLNGVDILETALRTTEDLLTTFETEKKQYTKATSGKKAEETISPTMQQVAAIRRIVSFLQEKPKGNTLGYHIAFVEGLAGTGKTRVVIGTILNIYTALTGESLDTVYTMAHTNKSSEILHQQLKNEGTPTTTETFLAKENLSGIKLLVIDEAPAVAKSTMKKVLDKVDAHNKSVPASDRIKIIALGDPAQITESDYPEISAPSRLGITVTNPFTAVYRTNVGPIVEYFTAYRLQFDPVQNVHTTVNSDLGGLSKTPVLYGVTGSTSQENLKAAAFRDSDTSKLIVVADEAAAARYRQEIPEGKNIEVIPVHQIGGMQVDEVYMDFPRSMFKDELNYNKAVFTAASRAKNFVYHRTSSIVPTVNPNILAKVEQEAQDIVDNADRYVKSLDDTTNTINDLLGTNLGKTKKVEPKERDKTPQSEETDEALQEQLDKGAEDPVKPTVIPEGVDGGVTQEIKFERPATGVKKGKATHALHFVSNDALSKGGAERLLGPIRIVPSTKISKGTNKRIKVWSVVGKIGDNLWKEIGVLGDEDFKAPETGPLLLAATKKVTTYLRTNAITRDGILRVRDQEEFDRATALEATLVHANPLTYVYPPAPDFKKGAEFNTPLDTAITQFFNGIATPLRSLFIQNNGKINWSKLKQHVKVGIFSYGETDDEFTMKSANNVNPNFRPEPGVPYMKIAISDSLARQYLGHTIPQQYIRLQRKGISKDNPYYQDIEAYYKDYLAFKQATGITMGTEEYSQVIVAAASGLIAKKNEQGIPVVEFNPNLDEAYNKRLADLGVTTEQQRNLAKALVLHLYGPRYSKVKFESKEAAQQFIDSNPKGKYKIDPEYSDDFGRVAILDNYQDDKYRPYKDWTVNAQSGKAAKAFSNIAISNPVIEGKNVRVTKS